MRSIIMIIMVSATLALAASDKPAIIPVSKFPNVIYLGGKQICNASAADCVKAGYRLETARAITPTGKRIVTDTIIQDPNDATRCIHSIVYEDKPVVVAPVITPEVRTNIVINRISFAFSTNGTFRGVTWLDAPKTNIAAGKE